MVPWNPPTSRRYVVRTWPGEGTCETVYQDQAGATYRSISEAEARQIQSSTHTVPGGVYRITRTGEIR